MNGIVSGHKCRSGRSADGLNVMILQAEAGHGQVLQVGGEDSGVVPGHIVVA